MFSNNLPYLPGRDQQAASVKHREADCVNGDLQMFVADLFKILPENHINHHWYVIVTCRSTTLFDLAHTDTDTICAEHTEFIRTERRSLT